MFNHFSLLYLEYTNTFCKHCNTVSCLRSLYQEQVEVLIQAKKNNVFNDVTPKLWNSLLFVKFKLLSLLYVVVVQLLLCPF